MKYNKMLCWVSRDEQKAIRTENKKHNIAIIFAKNKDDFISQIDDTSFLVVSIRKARYAKTFDIVRKFPSLRFYAFARLDDEFTTFKEFQFLQEANIKNPNEKCSQHREKELFYKLKRGLI